MLLLITSAVLLLLTWLYFDMRFKYKYFERRGIRYVPPVPVLGSMWMSVLTKKRILDEIRDAYNMFPDEKYFGIFEGTTPVLVVRDLDMIKKVTVKDSEHFIDHRNTLSKENDGGGLINNALIFLKGQKWREMRAALSPAFTGAKMRMMLPFMNEISQQMVKYLQAEAVKNGERTNPIDLYDLFTRCANDIVASCAFGMKVDSLHDRDNQFYSMGKRVTNFSSIKFLIVTFMPWLAKLLKIDIFPKESTSFFRNLVSGAMKYRETNGIVRQDMIHLLMEAKSGKLKHTAQTDDNLGFATVHEAQKATSKRQWTDDELAAQAFIFFFAGFDTTANALTFAAHELTINPHVQEKLRAEIDACRAENAEITYEVIQGLKYMDMVLSESLRKWASALVMERECVAEYTFDPPRHGQRPYTMKPKDYLYMYVNAIHLDQKYFPNPDKFDPERFSEERKHEIKPFSYLPFGSGPRNCIGSRFALMELKVLLYELLLNFELVACEKTTNPIQLAPGLKVAIVNGSWVTFKLRNFTQ